MTSDADAAFRQVDFNWATRLQDIWADPVADVPELHAPVRQRFIEKIESMNKSPQQRHLGWFIVGSGGAGKTHLLNVLRREAASRSAGFVLVDMTDVRNFWEIVLQGFLDSLQTIYEGNKFQYEVLIFNFIKNLSSEERAADNVRIMAARKTREIAKDVAIVLQALLRKHPKEARSYQDVIRGLICLNSADYDASNTGYSWLQGQQIDEDLQKVLGFTSAQQRQRDIVKGLSWVMSLGGPTVLAFDQLDPLIQQVKHQATNADPESAEEQGTARSIIEEIGGGLRAVVDDLSNTLTIVSCVEASLNLMKELVFGTNFDRFEQTPIALLPAKTGDVARSLIRERLALAYRDLSFDPPYDTWPFALTAFDELTNQSPREILQKCELYRRLCETNQNVSELKTFGEKLQPLPPPPDDEWELLDGIFENYCGQIDVNALLDESNEDSLFAPLYKTAFECLILEHQASIPNEIECIVETEFSGGKSRKPLHARLRIINHELGSREDHFCVRVLQRKHHSAYSTRLKAAMTQSGIDRSLKFRHLFIVRTYKPPGGVKTEALTRDFQQIGGEFHLPSEDEVRKLAALKQMKSDKPAHFSQWLQHRRPATKLRLAEAFCIDQRLKNLVGESGHDSFDSAGNELKSSIATIQVESNGEDSKTPEKPGENNPPLPQKERNEQPAEHVSSGKLFFGRKMIALGSLGDPVAIQLPILAKHIMILGGSGSGKSVTLRRIVEEVALEGIPSIVIDCARDMCCFDQNWPSSQTENGWNQGDDQRAERFHQKVEQVVWTPGSTTSGNPLSFQPIPDFTPVKDDDEELEAAIQMACDGLKDIVASGNSQKSKNLYGILVHSLKYFARHFPNHGLNGFIEFLQELPSDAELGIRDEQKLAASIAESLKVQRTTNPMLRDNATPLDPATLFGDDCQRNQVRISVVSLVKLTSDSAAHSFLNQLAMELFSWIKKHPHPPGDRALRGLLVIDEARDFVPSRKSTECKESMMRLAAQARKYGLGLVFATQHPKDVETKIVGNCATHLYGLNNSPASLATLQDLMLQKGGSGNDIPKLTPGQFFIHNADSGHKSPLRIQVPLSLSYSPRNPLSEEVILEKALKSRIVSRSRSSYS